MRGSRGATLKSTRRACRVLEFWVPSHFDVDVAVAQKRGSGRWILLGMPKYVVPICR